MKDTTTRSQAKDAGAQHYFTGRPCKHGHLVDRYTVSGHCKACGAEAVRQKAAFRKRECLRVLGPYCECCGEKEYVFLTLDHINKDGAAQRRELGKKNGTRTYKWLHRQILAGNLDSMIKRYRVLCANCNMAHAILGRCPHKADGV